MWPRQSPHPHSLQARTRTGCSPRKAKVVSVQHAPHLGVEPVAGQHRSHHFPVAAAEGHSLEMVNIVLGDGPLRRIQGYWLSQSRCRINSTSMQFCAPPAQNFCSASVGARALARARTLEYVQIQGVLRQVVGEVAALQGAGGEFLDEVQVKDGSRTARNRPIRFAEIVWPAGAAVSHRAWRWLTGPAPLPTLILQRSPGLPPATVWPGAHFRPSRLSRACSVATAEDREQPVPCVLACGCGHRRIVDHAVRAN